MNLKLYTFLILFLFALTSVQAQQIITDADLQGNTTYNWTKDNVYVLDGNVFLEEGGVLNIEAGTVIKGKATPSNGSDNTSALIITRGAQIFAEGTKEEPIIFTGELDDLSTTDDLNSLVNQLWGGVIILGNSIVGEEGGEDGVEGIISTEVRARYGGTDVNDNSGVLKFVSIRHGGSVLAGDNEINGLTLGGVGEGTLIDYVEVFANKDDGIEIFGGTVNVKHAVVAFVGDDSYDIDESWNGYLQHILSIQQDQVDDFGDHAIEYDGSEEADLDPNDVGRIYNGTFIGSGVGSINSSSNGARIRNHGAAQIWNSLFLESTDYMFRVDGGEDDTALERLMAGETVFTNNIVNGYGDYVRSNEQAVLDALAAGNTTNDTDPLLKGISRTTDGGLDPRLSDNSPALTGAATNQIEGDFVNYRGAFDNQCNWAAGWTALASYGYFPAGATFCTPTSVENAANEAGLKLAVPMPNPATDNLNLVFELPAASELTIHITDFTGKLMETIALDKQVQGTHNTTLNVANYQAGIYVIAIETAFGTVTQKFVKIN